MTQINSYLTFSGNCREAMTFYAACLGGELVFQTIGESPLADKMPPKMKDCILHSTLINGAVTIMASDMVGENGLITGNAVSLMLNCSSEEEIKNAYVRLVDGGQATHQLENTFWGALFGDLTDKFGNHWLLHFDKSHIATSKKKINQHEKVKNTLLGLHNPVRRVDDLLSNTKRLNQCRFHQIPA